MADFHVGSIVRLKSGGPTMTVVDPAAVPVGIDTSSILDPVRCTWFANNGVHSKVFPAKALVEVPALTP